MVPHTCCWRGPCLARPGAWDRRSPNSAVLCASDFRPGVHGVGMPNQGLLMGNDFGDTSEHLLVEGHPPKTGLQVFRSVVTPGSFEAAGIRSWREGTLQRRTATIPRR